MIARRIQFPEMNEEVEVTFTEVPIRKVDVRKHETAEIEFIVLSYYGESIVIYVTLRAT
jgi:hypothetical protein